MRWIQRYRITSFVRSALWLVPFGSLLLALLVIVLLRKLDQAMGWTLMGFGLDGARALLAMLAASMLTLLVFLLSSLLIAVQVASAQLTPRAGPRARRVRGRASKEWSITAVASTRRQP